MIKFTAKKKCYYIVAEHPFKGQKSYEIKTKREFNKVKSYFQANPEWDYYTYRIEVENHSMLASAEDDIQQENMQERLHILVDDMPWTTFESENPMIMAVCDLSNDWDSIFAETGDTTLTLLEEEEDNA